jgi:hypothetical protein
MVFRPLMIALIFWVSCGLNAQQTGGFYPETDTVPELDVDYIPKVKTRMFAGRPGKAALYSLIIPGAGQAYNKKYWQVPIVWGAVGTVGYFVIDNSKEYRDLRDAYRERLIAAQNGEPRPMTNGLATQMTRCVMSAIGGTGFASSRSLDLRLHGLPILHMHLLMPTLLILM